MADIINFYSDYTADKLRSLLIGYVPTGDPNELHNACLVLCAICQDLEKKIARLERKVAKLEGE